MGVGCDFCERSLHMREKRVLSMSSNAMQHRIESLTSAQTESAKLRRKEQEGERVLPPASPRSIKACARCDRHLEIAKYA